MQDDGFLVRKVLVNRTDRDAGSEGDAPRRGSFDAFALDESDSGVEDRAEGPLRAGLRRVAAHTEAAPLRRNRRARRLHWHAIRPPTINRTINQLCAPVKR